MKRLLSVLCALLLLAGLGACAGKAPTYKDNTYTKEAADFDSNGYKDIVTIVVSGGKITSVDWNAVDKDGVDKKTKVANGLYVMSEDPTKKDWTEQAKVAEDYVIEHQGTSGVKFADGKADALTGVTITTEEFFVLVEEALAEAK